jgi:hypothetical protein
LIELLRAQLAASEEREQRLLGIIENQAGQIAQLALPPGKALPRPWWKIWR